MRANSVSKRLASAATLLVVSDSCSDHQDRHRLVGDALETYVYWHYRTLGCTTTQSREAGRNAAALFRSGDLGGECWHLDKIIAQAKLDSRLH